jgi:hypothetical protein
MQQYQCIISSFDEGLQLRALRTELNEIHVMLRSYVKIKNMEVTIEMIQ